MEMASTENSEHPIALPNDSLPHQDATATATATTTATDATAAAAIHEEPKPEIAEEDVRGILDVIASTGKFWHDWDKLRSVLSFQLKQVLSEYPEAKMTSGEQNASLGETYLQLVKRLDEALYSFDNGPPFTLQRLCEILLAARSIYPSLSKLALALKKVQKSDETKEASRDVQLQSSSVENGVEPAVGDGDEIMVEPVTHQIDLSGLREEGFSALGVDDTGNSHPIFAAHLLTHPKEKEVFLSQTPAEQLTSLRSGLFSSFCNFHYWAKHNAGKIASLNFSTCEMINARDQAMEQCSRKQEEVEKLLKECQELIAALEVAKREAENNRLAMEGVIKREAVIQGRMEGKLSENSAKIAALNAELGAEKDRGSLLNMEVELSAEKAQWYQQETVKAMIDSFIEHYGVDAFHPSAVSTPFSRRAKFIYDKNFHASRAREGQGESGRITLPGSSSAAPL